MKLTTSHTKMMAVAALVICCAFSGCRTSPGNTGPSGQTGPAADGGKIVIATSACITGKYAEVGADSVNAMKMAVDQRNALGGIGGRQVELLIEDDKGVAKDAAAVAHKIAGNAAVVGVVGPLNSEAALAAAPIFGQAGLPMLLPSATNPDITSQGQQNVFRIPITDTKQGPACLAFTMDRLKANRIAIVHNKQTYGQGIATEYQKALQARGKQPLVFEGVSADDQDFRPVITRIRDLKPDAVFFGGNYAEGGLFIKQSRELGLKVPFVMGDGCFHTGLMKIAGAAADGCYVSNIAPMSAPSPEAKAFYTEFQQKHGKIVAFAPLAYVSTTILLDAIEKAQSRDRSGVLAVLRDPSYSAKTILGSFSFDEKGDSKGEKLFFHQIKGSDFVAYDGASR